MREAISVQQVGTELLLYDERQHRAFCLNATSAAVWKLADGLRTTEEICVAAGAELGIEVSRDLVSYALDELERDGLLQTAQPGERVAISRRQVLEKLGAAGAFLLPAIASILAPTAAQAYSGCFDCSDEQAARAARARKIQQANSSKTAPSSSPQQ